MPASVRMLLTESYGLLSPCADLHFCSVWWGRKHKAFLLQTRKRQLSQRDTPGKPSSREFSWLLPHWTQCFLEKKASSQFFRPEPSADTWKMHEVIQALWEYSHEYLVWWQRNRLSKWRSGFLQNVSVPPWQPPLSTESLSVLFRCNTWMGIKMWLHPLVITE